MSNRKGKKTEPTNGKLTSDLFVQITFEQFFNTLLRSSQVHPHHKTPLREFFKENNKLEASLEEFLALFDRY